MVIFAEIDRDTKLVKITTKELSNILGFDNTYDDGFKHEMLMVGKTIDIGKFVTVSKYVRNLNVDYLSKISDKCDAISKLIIEATDLVKEIESFDKLKESA